MARRNRRRRRNREREEGRSERGRRGGRGGSQRSGPTVVMLMDRPGGRSQRDGGGSRRNGGNRTMARGEGSRGKKDYARVTGDVGLQLVCEVGEVAGTLLVGAMDAVSAASSTTADDTAFPIVQKAVGSGMRAFGDMWLAKRHAGLAKVVSATGSAINGAVAYAYLQRAGLRVQKRMKEQA